MFDKEKFRDWLSGKLLDLDVYDSEDTAVEWVTELEELGIIGEDDDFEID